MFFFAALQGGAELSEDIFCRARHHGLFHHLSFEHVTSLLYLVALQGGAELGEDTIAESGISLLLAGTDTSGGGSTAALAMLAQFPHVMQRLHEEQQQVSGDSAPD
jgi:cytochrome P450